MCFSAKALDKATLIEERASAARCRRGSGSATKERPPFTIIVLNGAPVTMLAVIMNPIAIVLAGVDWWRDWLTRLHPHCWRLGFRVAVFGFSLAVYTTRST